MTPTLDDLINDDRLARLFSTNARACALQLWIMQIKSGQSIENRVIYGRLLPYSHASNRWSASDDEAFEAFEDYQVQVRRLNLYVNSAQCAALLRGVSAGRSVTEISEDMKLGLSDSLKKRFGSTALTADNLVYRPIAYLLNRDGHNRHSPSSPHAAAGAFSASITQINKGALFRVGQDYAVEVTASMVKQLNADTGLDFGDVDAARFGDLELLVFPALDDFERSLLSVSWTRSPTALTAQFNPMQLPHFNSLQLRLSLVNSTQIVYSTLATAERDAEGLFSCSFELSEQLDAITDSTELEIFGSRSEHARAWVLCCRWRLSYIREIHLQSHVVTDRVSPAKFDWLEKTTRPSASARVKAALSSNHGNPLDFSSRIGGREQDPWVSANRELASLFARIHPPKSEGHFFLRRDQGDGDGRLQFVEWFKALLAKHPQHQVIIFDPYFEDAGLDLILLYAAPGSDYMVFRSLPKRSLTDAEATLDEADDPTPSGINNLLANCEQNRDRLRHIKLRIYGLKDGRLHDRYILVTGADGLPVAGYNLSNSLQAVAEKHPLLVTPIPADVLLKVEQYKLRLIQEAQSQQPEGTTENFSMRLVFDSTALSPTTPQRYQPLRLLDHSQAGDILSTWANKPSLSGLSGDTLKAQMTSLGLLRDDSLSLPDMQGLSNCLAQQAGDFSDFTASWEMLGEVLANTPAGDLRLPEIQSNRGFLEFLARFLEESFRRVPGQPGQSLTVMEPRFFREPVEVLLASPSRPHQFSHAIKYTALTWPEYFAIKLLWWYAPETLVAIAEEQAAGLPSEPESPDVMRLSLLSQMVSEVSLAVQFDISGVQREYLLHSGNGLLQWMGLIAMEMQLEQPQGLATVLQWVGACNSLDKVRTLGWMAHRAARNPDQLEICKGLIAALHAAVPTTLSTEDLRHVVDSMRGHMRELAWTEPCLFQDVVFPLLRNGRANCDDACEIWMEDLTGLLVKDPPLLFNQAREGQMTNITAFLFSHSSPEGRQASTHSLRNILKRQRQIVQHPLASTSDWTRWDNALTVSMWILIFTRWVRYYLHDHGVTDQELENLSQDAHTLAMVRPMEEWRSHTAGKRGELAAFLDQVEALLVSSGAFRTQI